MSKSNAKYLTLKEASERTGIAVSALRFRVKQGKLEGLKNKTRHGETWYIKADSMSNLEKVESVKLKPLRVKQVNGEVFNPEAALPSIGNSLVQSQTEHIMTLKSQVNGYERQISVYEKLLADFQARLNVIESDKLHLEYQLKLLPAPVEAVSSKLEEQERSLLQKETALVQAREILRQAQQIQEQYKIAMAELQNKLREEEQAKELLRIQWEQAHALLKRPLWKKILISLKIWQE